MPRKLKVYETSLGFYDLAVAAPSMAAALRAWGASENIFQQGFAKESENKDVIAAAMAKPGVVLRRPVGSKKPFQEEADLPTAEQLAEHSPRQEIPRKKPEPPGPKKPVEQARRKTAKLDEKARRKAEAAKADEKAQRKGEEAFQKEERRRERERQRQEAHEAKARARRIAAMEQAKAVLEKARRAHDAKMEAIEKERASVERRAEIEEARWRKEQRPLEAAVQKARG
jgi:colicin import membrane protein